jgi:hypothetical protein
MGTLVRRFLVLAALMFWQGGFVFYAAVVVPVGQEQLGHLEQGFLTRQVTNWLNLSGAVALLPLAWDAAASHDSSARRRRLRWLTWLVMLIALGWLAWLHLGLDELLDPGVSRILDRNTFRTGHRWYLWLSSIQWGCGVLYAGLTLWAWRTEDYQSGAGSKAGPPSGGAKKGKERRETTGA